MGKDIKMGECTGCLELRIQRANGRLKTSYFKRIGLPGIPTLILFRACKDYMLLRKSLNLDGGIKSAWQPE